MGGNVENSATKCCVYCSLTEVLALCASCDSDCWGVAWVNGARPGQANGKL